MPEQAPCPACGTQCRKVVSESGRYFYLRCGNCNVMTMVPIDKKPVDKKEGSA